jgi:uncharacterized membrane protein YoaK (UPF0700 family)
MRRSDKWPKTDYQSRPLALAVCLAALAGYVDALGFLFMRGLYVSFMSGNSTRLSTDIGRADWHAAAATAGLIVAFVFGVVLGQLIAARNVALDLAAVGILLAAAGSLYWLGFPSVVTAIMAMLGSSGILPATAQTPRKPGLRIAQSSGTGKPR